ncbi:beta-carotene 15,15'-dioxygenase [Halobacteriales archaeon SW_7_68_16]|nr:MAG: beta-carotene 15,15'-dioxygenase [Halobacteriales archaeon SW_7_68_16]
MATVTDGVALPAPVRETLRVPAVWLPWLPVAACTVAFAAGLGLPVEWRYLPLAVSVVVLGLPHGAVDWAVLPRAVTGRLDARWVGVVLAVYAVAGGAYAVAWFLAPVGAAIAFIGLTWFHWGQGELHPLSAVVGVDYLDTRPRRALAVVVRGGLPMLVPLLAFPERYRTVVAAFAAPFGGTLATWPVTPGLQLALGAGFAALTVATLALGYRRTTDYRAWATDAGELALLWAFFLVVPPVFAVGVYFCCWHAARHVARVLTVDGTATAALERGELVAPLRRFAREAALPTAGGLLVCWALWTTAPESPTTVGGLAALYLVAIAVMTLPHVVVVTWLDRIQGYW